MSGRRRELDNEARGARGCPSLCVESPFPIFEWLLSRGGLPHIPLPISFSLLWHLCQGPQDHPQVQWLIRMKSYRAKSTAGKGMGQGWGIGHKISESSASHDMGLIPPKMRRDGVSEVWSLGRLMRSSLGPSLGASRAGTCPAWPSPQTPGGECTPCLPK